MDTLTIADLYAGKSQAKEKESYYRAIKSIDAKYEDAHTLWATVLYEFDKELSQRLYIIHAKFPTA